MGVQEHLIISALASGESEKLDRGALAQRVDEALRPLLREFNLSLTGKIVVEDDFVLFEDPTDTDNEPSFSFNGSIPPD